MSDDIDNDIDKDRGMTLIELVIGMAVGAVVAAIASYMLINTFRTQDTVTSSTAASTRGQAIGETIDAAMRNATAVKVSTDGTQLDVQRNDGSCESFRVSGSRLEHRRFASANKSTAPWADLSSYRPVAFQVSQVSSPATAPYFASPTPPTVSYGFRLANRAGAVTVASVASPRSSAGSTSACF